MATATSPLPDSLPDQPQRGGLQDLLRQIVPAALQALAAHAAQGQAAAPQGQGPTPMVAGNGGVSQLPQNVTSAPSSLPGFSPKTTPGKGMWNSPTIANTNPNALTPVPAESRGALATLSSGVPTSPYFESTTPLSDTAKAHAIVAAGPPDAPKLMEANFLPLHGKGGGLSIENILKDVGIGAGDISGITGDLEAFTNAPRLAEYHAQGKRYDRAKALLGVMVPLQQEAMQKRFTDQLANVNTQSDLVKAYTDLKQGQANLSNMGVTQSLAGQVEEQAANASNERSMQMLHNTMSLEGVPLRQITASHQYQSVLSQLTSTSEVISSYNALTKDISSRAETSPNLVMSNVDTNAFAHFLKISGIEPGIVSNFLAKEPTYARAQKYLASYAPYISTEQLAYRRSISILGQLGVNAGIGATGGSPAPTQGAAPGQQPGIAAPGAPRGAQPSGAVATPAPGSVDSGYRFRGGDPANPASWEKAQ